MLLATLNPNELTPCVAYATTDRKKQAGAAEGRLGTQWLFSMWHRPKVDRRLRTVPVTGGSFHLELIANGECASSPPRRPLR
jgi:hypothetical protein